MCEYFAALWLRRIPFIMISTDAHIRTHDQNHIHIVSISFPGVLIMGIKNRFWSAVTSMLVGLMFSQMG